MFNYDAMARNELVEMNTRDFGLHIMIDRMIDRIVDITNVIAEIFSMHENIGEIMNNRLKL